MLPLNRVRRATARRTAAEQEWREAVKDAVKAGESLRTVAGAAGVSHVRVLQVTREA
jgi:transposase-like protein